MNRFFRRLPLPAKLMLVALIPLILLVFLAINYYEEKAGKLAMLENYISKIQQSAVLTRLIDHLQSERQYSHEYVLENRGREEMLQQRKKTDSVMQQLDRTHDSTLKNYRSYTFLDSLAGFRRRIDLHQAGTPDVMHFFSASIFRLNTLNGITTGSNRFLSPLYQDLATQKLLSEMITYLGIVNANVFNILFSRSYVVETLMGTYPSFEVYRSYEKEFLQKASPSVVSRYNGLLSRSDFKNNIAYLGRLFSSFQLDTTMKAAEWNRISFSSINAMRRLQMDLLNQVEKGMYEIQRREKQAQFWSLLVLVVAILLAFGLTGYMVYVITKMLNELKRAAIRISEGGTDVQVRKESNDAIGSLARSIASIGDSNKRLAEAALYIGQGHFDVSLQPRSADDLLANALLQMKNNLQRSTKEIEESREQFRQLADFVPQIIWTADAHGRVDYFNKQWYEFTGAEKAFGDRAFISYLHPNDQEYCLAHWYHAVRHGNTYEIEYRFKDRQGNYRWFLGRAVPVKNAEGQIVKWFGSSTDIHEQKTTSQKLEQLVKERTMELERSNDDLQQFAHIASHDLKEPLRKIRIFSSRLKEEFAGQLPETGRNYIEKIELAAFRMSSMIDGVLNYSMAANSAQGFEWVDLNGIMSEVKQDLELLVQQKNAEIHHPSLPRVKGVKVLMYQLFYNLINNALKFSRPGQKNRIHISVSQVKGRDVNGSTHLEPDRDYVSIQVNDTGIGFDPAQTEKLFQIFSRLNPKDQYEGTGLGLALCKKIVTRHQGAITATGKENEGASFNVLLPAD